MYPSRVPLTKRTGLGGEQRVCQRCERPGHAIYECKNPRPYKSRPTRTQVLADPKLAEKPRPSESAPVENVRREGTATEVLAARERERERRPSPSSASDDDADSLSHPSSCSTCSPRSAGSHSPRSPARHIPHDWDEKEVSPIRRARRSPDLHDRRRSQSPPSLARADKY